MILLPSKTSKSATSELKTLRQFPLIFLVEPRKTAIRKRKNHQFTLSRQNDSDISSLVDLMGHFKIIMIINFL